MNQQEWLAEQFEQRRTHLLGAAYRMLGSRAEAEDALQEAWIRADRAGSDDVANVGGWLTTIVSRVCLDMLRTRKARREDAIETAVASQVRSGASHDPEGEALLADSVGHALMIVLDQLNPAERVAFVMHDLFDVPFDRIALVIGKSEAATRQLASRARRRVRVATSNDRVLLRRDEIVRAFLAASREGNLAGLLALLHPDVVLRADAATVAIGTEPETRGREEVARFFAGRARAAQPALLDGAPGLVWTAGAMPRLAFHFTFDGERIAGIDLVADPARLSGISIEV